MIVLRTVTREEWIAEARLLFGSDEREWRFVCPSCGHVASVADWIDAGANEGHVAFSCVGRFLDGEPVDAFETPGPCNYAGGGLFRLNPVSVQMPDGSTRATFEFAKVEASRS